MKLRIFGVALAAASFLAFGTQAEATTINYSFNGTGGSFSYTTNGFITSQTDVLASQLDSCMTSSASNSCTYELFSPNFNNRYDLLGFAYSFAGGSGTALYYFNVGSFESIGTHQTVLGSIGTLTVSEVAAVPEPTSWAMMLLGFALVGFAQRHEQGRKSLRTVSA